MRNESPKKVEDYSAFSYAFVGLVGAGLLIYLVSVSRLSVTLYFFITDYFRGIDLETAMMLSIVIVTSPIVLIIAQTIVSLASLVRSTGLIGYTYLLYNLAIKILIIGIPIAGVSSISLNPRTLLPEVDPMYIVMAIGSFTLAVITSYLGRKLSWVTIRAYLKEGTELIPLGSAALSGESPISVPPGRSLIIKIVGIPDALRRTLFNTIPPSAWEVSSDFKEHEILAELRPKTTGEAQVTILSENRLLGKLKAMLGSTLGFSKLIIEAIVSGKRSRIIETEHPVGMPLMYTIQRLRKFLPYGNTPMKKLTAFLVDDTMVPKPISLDFNRFEPGKEYHIIIKKGGRVAESRPLAPREEVIKVPLITPPEAGRREVLTPLTEEYRAKPPPAAPIQKRGEEPRSKTVTVSDDFVDACLRMCGDIW